MSQVVNGATLISGFCSVKRMRVFDSAPHEIEREINPSQDYLPTPERWKADLA